MQTDHNLFEFLANVSGQINVLGAEGFDSHHIALVAACSGVGAFQSHIDHAGLMLVLMNV